MTKPIITSTGAFSLLVLFFLAKAKGATDRGALPEEGPSLLFLRTMQHNKERICYLPPYFLFEGKQARGFLWLPLLRPAAEARHNRHVLKRKRGKGCLALCAEMLSYFFVVE